MVKTEKSKPKKRTSKINNVTSNPTAVPKTRPTTASKTRQAGSNPTAAEELETAACIKTRIVVEAGMIEAAEKEATKAAAMCRPSCYRPLIEKCHSDWRTLKEQLNILSPEVNSNAGRAIDNLHSVISGPGECVLCRVPEQHGAVEAGGAIGVDVPVETKYLSAIELLLYACVGTFRLTKPDPRDEDILEEICRVLRSVTEKLELQHKGVRYYPSLPQAISVIIDSGLVVIGASSPCWKYISAVENQWCEDRAHLADKQKGIVQEASEELFLLTEDISLELGRIPDGNGDKRIRDGNKRAFMQKWQSDKRSSRRMLTVPGGTFATFKPSGTLKHARLLCACRFVFSNSGVPQRTSTDNLTVFGQWCCAEVGCYVAWCHAKKVITDKTTVARTT
ncbi:hypothetical protein F4777DRAFT_582642 [Nemania sp. FL0916]|nr:hypothetical protein F4777DRAFT_582642 [Nemania sp. FL0916]